jgi:HlyD family secretion protein
MDKLRVGEVEKRRKRRMILLAVIAVVITGVSVGIVRMPPALPTLDGGSLFMGKVERGPMLREVRGAGQLVPVDIRWIAAPLDGRIESIPALPGVSVGPDTILMELSNPEVEQSAFEAESNLHAAEADLQNLRALLSSALLNQQAQMAAADSEDEQARLQVEADQKLYDNQIIPELNLKRSRLRADQLGKQSRIEKERCKKTESSNRAQIAAQEARVSQFRALYELRRRQVASLKVRAGIPSVLLEMPVQVGQRVPAGMNLARVARPELLKAEVRIQETQAKDVTAGRRVAIDTRNGIVPGHVERVSPSSQEGQVTMDVALDGPLPAGARPYLQIDGTIEIERLPDVLFVGRPSFAQQGGTVSVFKMIKGGKEAIRVPVRFGKLSVNTAQVLSGLAVGDEIILSDTSQVDGFDQIGVTH